VNAASPRILTDDDYRRLAELRHGQRLFLEWSAERAQRAGLTPTQHQLLLGVRASTDPAGPTIGDVAEFMVIRHHSAVELVDRAERAGLVTRARDPERHTVVRLALTVHGERTLASLSEIHLRELAELAPRMSALWDAVGDLSART
jgi:DNA-binding MarR family transcriptional regulator